VTSSSMVDTCQTTRITHPRKLLLFNYEHRKGIT